MVTERAERIDEWIEKPRKGGRETERAGNRVDWGRRDPCNINISCMLTRRN